MTVLAHWYGLVQREEDRRLVALLKGLIDEVGEDESHPLASLVEIVGVLVEKYEDAHVPELALN
ncbi:MAG TPA: hypothetical protein VF723_16025 [Pyrinomonadaceae bacterium]|jgi:HTH-type transcriptional regulator/antitoxin HigA